MYEYFSNRVQIRHQVFEKNYQLLLLLLFPIAASKETTIQGCREEKEGEFGWRLGYCFSSSEVESAIDCFFNLAGGFVAPKSNATRFDNF